MECPACTEPMAVLEYDAVELDYCTACRGVWLDAGEVELLFGDPKACATFLAAGAPAPPSREKPRRCPICGKPMAKGLTAGQDPVTYDYCTRNDGLWFDRAELAQVLKQGANVPGGGARITEFLQSVFSAEAARPPEEAAEQKG